MTDIHAPERAEHRSAGPGAGPRNGADPRNGTGAASPFATYRPGDYVRDVIAALVLLLALALPWTAADHGADRVEVVLATAVSLASLALPYLARFGALPVSWTVQATRRWRVWANAPTVVVALVVIALDLGSGSGVGTGVGLGLAGALLAATPRDSELGPAELDGRVHDRWRTGLALAGGLVAACALVSLVQTYISDRELGPMLRAPLGFALVAGLLLLLVFATWRRDRAARLVLLALGVVLIVLAVFTSGSAVPGVESTHGQRFGLVLFPALAALAGAPAVRRSPVWESREAGPVPGAVDVWVRAAVRAFQVLVLFALCSAGGGLVSLVADGFDVAPLLRLILGLVIAGVAWFGQRSLRRDTSTGHVPAVGAACVTGVLGLVVVVATSGGGDGPRIVDLVTALGLPGIAASALMVPKAVREHFQTSGIAGDGAADHSPAWIWAPAAADRPATLPDKPAREREQIPTSGTHVAASARSGAGAEDGAAGQGAPPGAPASGAQPVADAAATPDAGPWQPAAEQSTAGHTTGQSTVEQATAAARATAAASAGTGDEQPSTRDVTAMLRPASGAGPAAPAAASPDSGSVPATPDRPRKRVSSTGAVRTYAGQEHRAASGEQPSVTQVAKQPTAREMQSLAARQDAARETAVMQPVQGGARPAGVDHAAQPTLVGQPAQPQPAQPQQRAWTPEVALDPRTPLADLAVIVQEAPHLRPHVARNPSTYPALLDWLGGLGDPDVDAALRSRRQV
ncbi:hypothetical protein [Myceligenerans pegani]|uniref:Uncharacterized protein n=1 Tax=Myceligenerans pegani TaxID=2776917 RepID=A0ABR9N3N1_9MICO|nr:hypothetical protein [Myceligenerans sp. TRM 65318]MBE1877791.1 hypothetical protein [Myceligenerans sp. TRM 65318]MBE3020062.1 hypothetical protein [Myceligenerans sp. TRM 65318]